MKTSRRDPVHTTYMNTSWRLALVLCLSHAVAQADEIGLTYGYGMHDAGLRWSIAGNIVGTSPNILSELTWRNLKGSEHLFGLNYISSSGWMGRADICMSNFNAGGEVQDSDYLLDNRNGENSRSISAVHGSSAQDVTLIAGHRLFINESQAFALTPVIGISRNVTDLRMNNGVQVIPATGPYPNMDSSYRAQLDSLLAGAEAIFWFTPAFGLDMKWHHYWFNYHAEANWNMRTDFQHPISFYHNGNGTDNKWSLGFLARVNKEWSMELAHSIRRGMFQNGLDVVNLAVGSKQSTLLRDVEWSSAATSLALHYSFY